MKENTTTTKIQELEAKIEQMREWERLAEEAKRKPNPSKMKSKR